ncbi:MAG: hypothetical protein ACR2PI_12665, partial [Hyphomicrobiaceae bacterium]
MITAEKTTSKERCAAATPAADFTIDQHWPAYAPDEHARWDRLFADAWATLQGRACGAFLDAVEQLELSQAGIPDMRELSDRLEPLTGWRVVPVAGLVPDEVFFEHLANRRFPAGAFIRSEAEMEYLEEPDIFHDIFGHVPLLANPEYAAFMQAYGKGGRRAMQRGQLHNLARLYWYTIEFGLVREASNRETPTGVIPARVAGIHRAASESVAERQGHTTTANAARAEEWTPVTSTGVTPAGGSELRSNMGRQDGDSGLRLFGAGIMSSTAESIFALEDPSPNRIQFDLERVMRTNYIIDDF